MIKIINKGRGEEMPDVLTVIVYIMSLLMGKKDVKIGKLDGKWSWVAVLRESATEFRVYFESSTYDGIR